MGFWSNDEHRTLYMFFAFFIFNKYITTMFSKKRQRLQSAIMCCPYLCKSEFPLQSFWQIKDIFFSSTISSLLSSNPKVFPIKKWFWKSWNGWRRPLTRIVLSSEAVYILSPEDGMKMDVTAFVCSRIS